MTELYIFHLDDEPNYVNWIPSVIFNQIKELIDASAQYSGEEREGVDVTFVEFEFAKLGPIKLVYELHEDKEKFLSRVEASEPSSIVLYVFDLKLLGDGDAGAEVAKSILAKTKTGPEASSAPGTEWFYLTGFPEAADAALGALNLGGKVVAKPPNSADLASDVLEILKTRLISL